MITIVIEWHEIVAVLVSWVVLIMVKRWIMLDGAKRKLESKEDEVGE